VTALLDQRVTNALVEPAANDPKGALRNCIWSAPPAHVQASRRRRRKTSQHACKRSNTSWRRRATNATRRADAARADGFEQRHRARTRPSGAAARRHRGYHGTERSELSSQMAALQERLLAVESERTRYQRLAEGRHVAAQQSVAALTGERDALSERVRIAETSVGELQTALTGVRGERDR